MATVYAGIGNDKVYVFRRNFKEKRWDNVATGSKTCKVHFLKRNGTYYFKFTPEDNGATPVIEFPIVVDNPASDSGQGFLQVPLPNERTLYGVQFKNLGDAAAFQAKMEAELHMRIPKRGMATMPPGDGVNPHGGGVSMALPAPILPDNPTPYGGPLSQPARLPGMTAGTVATSVATGAMGQGAQPVPVHQQQQFARAGDRVYPQSPPQGSPAFSQPDYSPLETTTQGPFHPPQGVGVGPQVGQMGPQGGQMGRQGAGFQLQSYQIPYQHPHSQPMSAMPNRPMPPSQSLFAAAMSPPHQPIVRAQLPSSQAQPYPFDPRGPGYGPMQAKPANLGVSPPIHRKQFIPPTPPPSQNIHNMAVFLANAINEGNNDAAKGMIDILTDLPNKKGKFTVKYDETKERKLEEKIFTLEVQIEFQASNKNQLPVFIDVKESDSIDTLQQKVEIQFRIPKVTQNWIIGPKLVKSTELQTTLREHGITGGADKAKVFLYVMHAKKAGVTEEELTRIKQRQQQMHRQQVQAAGRPSDLADIQTPQGTLEPIYEHLSHRGYQPLSQQHLQQRQLATGQVPHPPGYPAQQQQQYPQGQPYYPPQLPPKVRAQGGYVEQAGDRVMNIQGGYPPVAVTRGAPPQVPMMGVPVEQMPALKERGVPNAALPQQAFMGYPNQDLADPNAQLDGPVPPEPPKVEPKKEEEKVGWVCVGCTFINRPRRPGCEQCGTARPVDYVIPADCPPDQDELRILQQQEENERLFHQLQEQEKQQLVVERQENLRALLMAEDADLNPNTEAFDCPICLVPYEPGEGVTLRGCLHQFCKECLHNHIKLCADAEVTCPFGGDAYQCQVPIAEREIKGLVTEEELEELYRRGLRQAESAAANSFHCRTPNCGGFCFYEDEVNDFDCPICAKRNCLICKAIHEGMNCQEYQEDLKRLAENDAAAKATQDMLEQLVRNGDAMYCPSCKIVVQKKDGCDWIKCSVCKTEICWATKGPRWGPNGRNDTSGGCKCRVGGKKCHPLCRNCH